MIKFAKKELRDKEIACLLHEDIRKWFLETYKTFTPPQRYAIKEVKENKNVLICSPTGSGKTLAAFLSILNELYELEKKGKLEDKVYCIYVSPLRALNNDIKRNLLQPLEDLKKRGLEISIRIGVRTSDTTQTEKSRMLKKPPHILITTPETLAILLNAKKFSHFLNDVKWVIVDEIHALVENKRGAHLSLSLERLAEKANFIRIGLSATVHPLEEVAKYLVGTQRDCIIVDVNYLKKTRITIKSPVEDLIYTDNEAITNKMYELLDKIIEKHKTTLIFTNTRSATERIAFHLKQKFGEKYIDNLATHHSSLSRETRLDTEEKLKKGKLKAVISSTSLELGIDIGNIDAVVLITSPKSVSRALQRIGRSGHRLHEESIGYIIVMDRDDAVECTVLAKNALDRKFDKIRIQKKPFDVLVQHLLGIALEGKTSVEKVYKMIKRSYVYKDLTFNELERTLAYLSGSYEGLESRNVYGKIWYENGEFGKRGKMTRAIYYMNTGTIPEETYVKVFLRTGKYLGNLEEEFVEKLVKGDVFVLGGKTYEFLYSRGNKIIVDPALERKPTIPAWFSEMLPLSYELALEIENFRAKLASMEKEEAIAYLIDEYKVDEKAAIALYNYIEEQKNYSIVPDKHNFLVEEYEDENFRNYIFHSLAGRKANEALARSFAYILGKNKGLNIRVTISDYGFMLSVPRWRRVDKEDIENLFYLDDETIIEGLKNSLEESELLKRRFRHVAVRGLLVLKRYGKNEKSVTKQQLSSEGLLKYIKLYYPDFILLEEAYNECLYDAMHIDEALDYIKRCSTKFINFMKGLKVPSPFAFNIVATGGKDVILMEERREFIRRMHEKVMEIIKAKKKKREAV